MEIHLHNKSVRSKSDVYAPTRGLVYYRVATASCILKVRAIHSV